MSENIEKTRNRNRQGIRQSNRSGLHSGCIRFGKNETFAHFIAKCIQSYYEKQKDLEIITEAIFNNGKRADLFCSDDNGVIEVMESETLSDCANKLCSYPDGIKPTVKTAKEIIDKYLGSGVYERISNTSSNINKGASKGGTQK